VVYSPRSLDVAYGEGPVVFAYNENQQPDDGSSVFFTNNVYAIEMAVKDGQLAVGNAYLFGIRTGNGVYIPFTKIKQTCNCPYTEPENRMINIVDIEESGLIDILFKSDILFDEYGARVVATK
ncbi:hypothetical protein KJ780_04165, partial [Candidatus Micrarchaeota archaeon]|nr:hypothetical protein [Candidatus Micrarchaeota archaeon]